MAESKGSALRDTFKAWLDKIPGANNTLHVKGRVEYGSGGLAASLARAEPQGTNPTILILEVIDTQEGDVSTKPIVVVDVAPYSEPRAEQFKQVTIRSAAPEFTINVEIVH